MSQRKTHWTVVVAMLVVLTPIAPSFAEVRQPIESEFTDPLRVVRVINDIDEAIVEQDSARAATYFTDTLRVDFSVLIGGEPVVIAAADFVASRRVNESPTGVSSIA